MGAQEEDVNLIYALRGIQVLIGAGVGIEATMAHIAKGGYGRITSDFSKALDGVNTGQRMEDELRRLVRSAKSDDYRRLLNSMLTNVVSNTDLAASLEQQANRAEENRNDRLKRYVEDLSGLPEKALILGFLSPLIFGLLAITPYLFAGLSDLPGMSVPSVEVTSFLFRGGLFISIVLLGFMLLGARSKEPGV